MTKSNSPLDGFGDEETGQLSLFTHANHLRIPSQVEITCKIPPSHSSLGIEDVTQLAYPSDQGQWRVESNTQGVLNAFLKLPNSVMTNQAIEKVRTFAAAWGPLWLCQTPGHQGYGSADCYRFFGGPNQISPCSWEPEEPIGEFIRKAGEARATLEIAQQLRSGHKASKERWQETGINRRGHGTAASIAQSNLTVQRKTLAILINWQLLSHQLGPTLLMTWDVGDHGKLELARGGSFLNVVWLQIAHLLCNVKGLYQCDECGDYYIRHGRQPQAGRRQFCESCGVGGKASKRQYARRERADNKTP